MVLLLALVVPALAAGPASAAETEPSFCQSRTLHDYLTPFKRMPKLRELPFRGRSEPLFRGVYLGSAGPSLAINGGRAGYQFQWEKNPKWDITLTFAQVSPDGSVIGPIAERHVRLAPLAPVESTEPSFAMPGKPALYRTTLLIRAASGRKLAEFGNYYRVIRPRIDASMVADALSYKPGDTLFARIENPGAAAVLFGEEYEVEELQGGSWAPASAVPEPIHTPLHSVAAGTTSGSCDIFPIPASMPAGVYRISQEVVISWRLQAAQRRPNLYAEFEVAAP